MKNSQEPIVTKGLTWRSFSAILFSVFIVQPVIIYFYLISNINMPLQAWITIILWAELARFMGSRLTKKEFFMLLTFQPMSLLYALTFVGPIQNLYFATSEPAIVLGVAKDVPDWWAPRGSVVQQIFNSEWVFLNSAWAKILGVNLLSQALVLCMDFALGYFNYFLFVKVENLQFPSAYAQAQTVIVLSEREHERIRAFLLSATVGFVINIFTKFVPFILGAFLYGGLVSYGYYVSVLDLTDYLDRFLPGATFTLSSDIVWCIYGLPLPVNIALAQFIGAFAFYFVGSHLVTSMNLWPSESSWATGWGWSKLVERTNLYFYTSIFLGLTLAAIVIPILLRPKVFLRVFSLLRRGVVSEESRRMSSFQSVYMIIILFLIPALGLSFLSWYLTDFQFPLPYILLSIIGGTFFITYLTTASLGVTFTGIPTVPYLREFMIYESGYTRRDVWFAPIIISSGGSQIAQSLLQADLCDVKHREFFKTYLILILLGLLSSFIFVSIFWRIAPIPSSAYPSTITAWPVNALAWARGQVWIWSGYLFKETWILFGFILGSVIYVISLLFHAPYFLVSFISGGMTGFWYQPILGTSGVWFSPIAGTLNQLIGSIVSQKIMYKRFGEKWRVLLPMVVWGYIMGDGFMEILRAVIILTTRSMWLLPY
jgi:hypothetical protein